MPPISTATAYAIRALRLTAGAHRLAAFYVTPAYWQACAPVPVRVVAGHVVLRATLPSLLRPSARAQAAAWLLPRSRPDPSSPHRRPCEGLRCDRTARR